MQDSSRTVHAVLSNNCSTLHWSDKTYTVHTVSTKTTHSWTWLGRSLTSLKQSLKHHQLSPNNYTRQHVYLRTKHQKLSVNYKKHCNTTQHNPQYVFKFQIRQKRPKSTAYREAPAGPDPADHGEFRTSAAKCWREPRHTAQENAVRRVGPCRPTRSEPRRRPEKGSSLAELFER